MSQLKLIGKQRITDIEFTGIEGGFGEDKRAMLVKEIAEIHSQPFGEVNRRINENIARFKNGIDILDVKANGFEPLGLGLGFTKQVFNQSNNIYILSERGYAKLLKILEDDKAWELYDKLVDGYFKLRAEKQKKPSEESTKRLEIMELNAKMRQAKLIFDVTHRFRDRLSNVAVESLLAAGTKTLTGQVILPSPKVEQRFHTCEEIAKILGALSEKGLPHNKAIAALIRNIGFEESEIVTVVESTGPWQGTTDKYADSVIPRLVQRLDALGYPPVLQLDKAFKIVWKNKSKSGGVQNV